MAASDGAAFAATMAATIAPDASERIVHSRPSEPGAEYLKTAVLHEYVAHALGPRVATS